MHGRTPTQPAARGPSPDGGHGDRREARRERVLELIGSRTVRNHKELQELLARDGFTVNQATLSRDLRDLGVVKGPDGYEVPAAAAPTEAQGSSLWHAVRTWLLAATAAQNQVVLRTPPSAAQPLALALDRNPLPGLVGTIAGDDTVLAICTDSSKARALARRLLTIKTA